MKGVKDDTKYIKGNVADLKKSARDMKGYVKDTNANMKDIRKDIKEIKEKVSVPGELYLTYSILNPLMNYGSSFKNLKTGQKC